MLEKDPLTRFKRLIQNIFIVSFFSFLTFEFILIHENPITCFVLYCGSCHYIIRSISLIKVIISGKANETLKEKTIDLINKYIDNDSLKDLLIKELSINTQLYYVYDYFSVLNQVVDIAEPGKHKQKLFALKHLKLLNK